MSIESMTQEEPDLDYGESFIRLSKDLKKAAKFLRRRDARWFVDQYYVLQDNRIRAASQLRTSKEIGEPDLLLEWMLKGQTKLEQDTKQALGEFSSSYRVGQWMTRQVGIGPVISAGMLAHFDVRNDRHTAGCFWRYCGIDPTNKWLGKEKATELLTRLNLKGKEATMTEDLAKAVSAECGQKSAKIYDVWFNGFAMNQKTEKKKGYAGMVAFLSKRPWNADLKCLICFKLGECMVKFQNKENCYYGKLFAAKKAEIAAKNERGEFAAVAASEIATKGDSMKGTQRLEHWKKGRIAPAHVHDRARRWMVMIFISHLHEVMHWDEYGCAPPAPYIFTHPNEFNPHTHLFTPPHFTPDWKGYEGKSIKEMKD